MMSESEVMFLARDTVDMIMQKFALRPYEDSDVGRLAIGKVSSTGQGGEELVRPRIVPADDRLDEVRRMMRDAIEEAIHRAVRQVTITELQQAIVRNDPVVVGRLRGMR